MCNERPGLERMKVGTRGVVRSRVGVGGGLKWLLWTASYFKSLRYKYEES